MSGNYIMAQQRQHVLLAKNHDLPHIMRLHMAMIARSDPDGHAQFAPGELAEWLSVVDRKTGELKPMDAANLKKVIRQAKNHGLIHSESTARCLRRLEHLYSGGDPRKRRPCPIHSTAGGSNLTPHLRKQNRQQDAENEEVSYHGRGSNLTPQGGKILPPVDADIPHHDAESGSGSLNLSPAPHDPAPAPVSAPPAADLQQVHGQGLALDGENSQIQSRPAPTTDTGDVPAWQPKDHHHRQAEQLGFPVDMERVTSRFLQYHGHKTPAALDGLFTDWLSREKDTRPEFVKRRDAEREHAEKLWARYADDNDDGNRDPVAIGSILEHLPSGARKHIAAARARRARAEQALRTA